MQRRSRKFFLLSLAVHASFLLAVYEIGCPRAIVHSEPAGVTVHVLTGEPVLAPDDNPHAVTHAAKKPKLAAPTPAAAPTSQLGNSSAAAPASAAGVGDPRGVEAGAKERYLYELRLLLDSRKQYPPVARSLRQEGAVEVSFLLRPDGRIEDTNVTQPSSHETLNRAALQLVEAVGRFKPLPTELQKLVGWRVSVPIEYRLK